MVRRLISGISFEKLTLDYVHFGAILMMWIKKTFNTQKKIYT